MSLLTKAMLMVSCGSGFFASYYTFKAGSRFIVNNAVFMPWSIFLINKIWVTHQERALTCSENCRNTRIQRSETFMSKENVGKSILVSDIMTSFFYAHAEDCPNYNTKNNEYLPSLRGGLIVLGMQTAGFMASYALVRASVCAVNLVFSNIPRVLKLAGDIGRRYLTSDSAV